MGDCLDTEANYKAPLRITNNQFAEKSILVIDKAPENSPDTPVCLHRCFRPAQITTTRREGKCSILGLLGFQILERAFPVLPLPSSYRRCTPNRGHQVPGFPGELSGGRITLP